MSIDHALTAPAPIARLGQQRMIDQHEARHTREVNHMRTDTKRAAVIGIAMTLLAVPFAGCADLSALDKEFKDLQAQLNDVSSDVEGMKASLDEATEASLHAKEAADNAASTATQALITATSAQRSVEATNERLEQLSPEHPPK